MLAELFRAAALNGSTAVVQLDTLNPAAKVEPLHRITRACGLHWAFPRNSQYAFLCSDSRVAQVLHEVPVHDEVGAQAVLSRALVAHNQSMAQLAQAAKLYASSTVSADVVKTFALVALSNVTVAPACVSPPCSQTGHRPIGSGLPRVPYPAAVARRVPKSEWAIPRFRVALDRE